MSAGQESGSPIRENRTLLPAPLPPDEARGTLAAAAGVSTVGLRPPFDTPAAAFSSRLSRRSHLDCRARRLLVSYNLTLDVFCADFGSCESWDNEGLCEATEGGGSGPTDFREVISIGSGDLFDDADFTQAMELPREPGGG